MRAGWRRAALLAFVLAAVWGALLLIIPVVRDGQLIDLESVVPFWGDSVTGSGASSAHSGIAALILIAVPLVAALPLVAPRGATTSAMRIAAFVVGAFALLSMVRIGLLYLPSAALLLSAARERPVVAWT